MEIKNDTSTRILLHIRYIRSRLYHTAFQSIQFLLRLATGFY